jgi:tetratricopeptide (TPR) repeat protein
MVSAAELQASLAQAHRLFFAGDLAAAEALLQDVLARAPNDINTLNLMGGVKRARGDRAGALAMLTAAAEHAPQVAPIIFNRANVLLELGRYEEALRGYDSALKLRADHGEAHLNRATTLAALGRHGEAIDTFERASALGMIAHTGRGASLTALGRHEEALSCFREALQVEPRNIDAWFNYARTLQTLEQPHEAVAAYDEVLKLHPQSAATWDNRGVALHLLDRLDDAMASYDEALRLEPGRHSALSNRGLALFDLGRIEDAIASFDRALALSGAEPDPVRAATLRYNRGAAYLRAHRFAEGWPGFEARWEAGLVNSQRHDRSEPDWRGERLNGVLRIWPEQGIGDEVLFARLASLARKRTDRILLECAPRLAPLFARSFPDLEVTALGAPDIRAQAQIAAASLGVSLQIDEHILSGEAFLRADAARAAAFRARYDALARGRPIVGIAWSSASPRRGVRKSAPLAEWPALLERDYFFVNLQYGEAAKAAEGLPVFTDPDVDQLADLDTFAAQIAALDQVVSVSNTGAHLAGALGVPCIVMPPPARGRLWYWGVEGETTPWYESVTIVRRALDQPWAAQIAAAADLVAQRFGV